MLSAYRVENHRVTRTELKPGMPVPDGTAWLDLFAPTAEEVHTVENALDVDVPTPDEMKEIEASSRLYIEDGTMVMTALVLAQVEMERPMCSAITFMPSHGKLVTLRYSDPLPFRAFTSRTMHKPGHKPGGFAQGEAVLMGLMDAIIDRGADILERIGDEVNNLSFQVFSESGNGPRNRDLKEQLRREGYQGDMIAKARESLVSLGRMLSFIAQRMGASLSPELRGHVDTLTHDAASLSDHATFLSGKVNFLLETTLGLINVEQNNIIKIFSVAGVALMPPTLIASVYGMNFRDMPELGWPLGYPLAVILMIVSAILPYIYFKRKGWL
ncbi:MAG: magnesium transporter CorA family protein [Alphaproteobacteria bacterium]